MYRGQSQTQSKNRPKYKDNYQNIRAESCIIIWYFREADRSGDFPCCGRSGFFPKMEYLQVLPHEPAAVKRETGENPVLSRNCKRYARGPEPRCTCICICPFTKTGAGIPAKGHWQSPAGKTREGCRKSGDLPAGCCPAASHDPGRIDSLCSRERCLWSRCMTGGQYKRVSTVIPAIRKMRSHFGAHRLSGRCHMSVMTQ